MIQQSSWRGGGDTSLLAGFNSKPATKFSTVVNTSTSAPSTGSRLVRISRLRTRAFHVVFGAAILIVAAASSAFLLYITARLSSAAQDATPGPVKTALLRARSAIESAASACGSDIKPALIISKDEFEAELAAANSSESWRRRFFFFLTKQQPHGESWSDRNELFLSSLFLHEPDAEVYFVATAVEAMPRARLLQPFVDAGYHLRGMELPLARMAAAGWWTTDANLAWLEHVSQPGYEAPFLYSHVSDYLRFLLLSRYGGAYTDTDSVQLRAYPDGEFAGLDVSDDTADWFIDPAGHAYAAPGIVRLAPGPQGLAARALARAFDPDKYDPHCFNCVGPRVLNELLRESGATLPQQAGSSHAAPVDMASLDLTILPIGSLYPLNYVAAPQLLAPAMLYGFEAMRPPAVATQVETVGSTARLWADALHRAASAMHLFGHVTGALPVAAGSVVRHAMRTRNLLADGARQVCSLAGAAFEPEGSPAPLVVTGARLALRDEALMFVRECPRLRSTACVAAAVAGAVESEVLIESGSDSGAAAAAAASGYLTLQVRVEFGTLTLHPERGASTDDDDAATTPHTADASPAQTVSVRRPSFSTQAVNALLHRFVYTPPLDESLAQDSLTVAVTVDGDTTPLVAGSARILVLRRLVTVVAYALKPADALLVRGSYEALQTAFPGTRMIVTDASPWLALQEGERDGGAAAEADATRFEAPFLTWVQPQYYPPLPAAESSSPQPSARRQPSALQSWWAMADAAATPFVFVLDARMTLTVATRLDLLLQRLLLEDVVGGHNRETDAQRQGAPILAAASVRRAAQATRQYRGLLREAPVDVGKGPQRMLQLEDASYGLHGGTGCARVDVVPTAFLARTAPLLALLADTVQQQHHLHRNGTTNLKKTPLGASAASEPVPGEAHPQLLPLFLAARAAGATLLGCDHVEVSLPVAPDVLAWGMAGMASENLLGADRRLWTLATQHTLLRAGVVRFESHGGLFECGAQPPESTSRVKVATAADGERLVGHENEPACCRPETGRCVTGNEGSTAVLAARRRWAVPGRTTRVGFVTYATGPYNAFVEDLWASILRFAFVTDAASGYPPFEAHLFVFTDAAGNASFLPHPHAHKRQQARLGWPYDSLGRQFLYHAHAAWFGEAGGGMDFLYSIDSDALLVAPVDATILGDRVGTLHQWFFGRAPAEYPNDRRLTVDGRSFSTAHIGAELAAAAEGVAGAAAASEGQCYVCGGMYGGTRAGFAAIVAEVVALAAEDLAQSPPRVALWHDESYLNRAFIAQPPTLLLAYSFMYPEAPVDRCLFYNITGTTHTWHLNVVDGAPPTPDSDVETYAANARFLPRILNLGGRKHLSGTLQAMQPPTATVPDLMSGTGAAVTVALPGRLRVQERVTFIIKAFERPTCLGRLLRTVAATFPAVRVLVLDDSLEPMLPPGSALALEMAALLPRLTVVRAGYDGGLAAGRNALLALVETPYTLLLDDDFELLPGEGGVGANTDARGDSGDAASAGGTGTDAPGGSRIEHLLAALEWGQFDLAGGCVDSAWGYRVLPALDAGVRVLANATGETVEGVVLLPPGTGRLEVQMDLGCAASDGTPRPAVYETEQLACFRVDMINNFFLGRTEFLRHVRWDPRLKMGEHEDFFLRVQAAGGRVGLCRGATARNDNSCDKTPAYKRLRARVFGFWVTFFRKWGLRQMRTAAGVYTLVCEGEKAAPGGMRNASGAAGTTAPSSNESCTIDVQQDSLWFA